VGCADSHCCPRADAGEPPAHNRAAARRGRCRKPGLCHARRRQHARDLPGLSAATAGYLCLAGNRLGCRGRWCVRLRGQRLGRPANNRHHHSSSTCSDSVSRYARAGSRRCHFRHTCPGGRRRARPANDRRFDPLVPAVGRCVGYARSRGGRGPRRGTPWI
jgi:hypothetical protein